jgi:hypothetical protein
MNAVQEFEAINAAAEQACAEGKEDQKKQDVRYFGIGLLAQDVRFYGTEGIWTNLSWKRHTIDYHTVRPQVRVPPRPRTQHHAIEPAAPSPSTLSYLSQLTHHTNTNMHNLHSRHAWMDGASSAASLHGRSASAPCRGA